MWQVSPICEDTTRLEKLGFFSPDTQHTFPSERGNAAWYIHGCEMLSFTVYVARWVFFKESWKNS